MIWSKVDLPEPLIPSKAVDEEVSNVNEISSNKSSSPNRLLICCKVIFRRTNVQYEGEIVECALRSFNPEKVMR
jgi:hypothetical protein